MKSLSSSSLRLGSGRLALCAALFTLLLGASAQAEDFTWHQPGDIAGGNGRVDQKVYVPGMRFPIQNAPAYANSQVHGHGGYLGPGGGQCDSVNYSYPWRDNYCESRSYSLPLCPSGTGHQGQDIRPSTCQKGVHPAVAAQDGVISSIGSYSVSLTADDGTRHRYLHLDMGRLSVSLGQRVTRGQRLGYISNDFGGTPTTIHLHYDLYQHVSGIGKTYVPTYMSLLRSYEALLGTGSSSPPTQPGCEALPAAGGILDNVGTCFALHGPSTTWRHVTSAGHGGSLYWSKAWNGASPSNWAEWRIGVQAAGRYDVEVWLEPGYASSKQSKWAVRASGAESAVRLDLSLATGWVRLGTYDFATGTDPQWVRVYDNTGEASSLDRRFPADAIRLVPSGGSSPVVPGPTPDPVDITGCRVPHEGGIMDSKGTCLTLHGPSQYWREVSGSGHGGSLYWTKAYAGSARSNWAEWRFEVADGGVYKVEVYNEQAYGTSQRARFGLDVEGQEHLVRLDLSREQGWAELGMLTMRPGRTQRVTLSDNTGEASSLGRRLPADAVRLTRVADDTGGSVVILPAGNGTGGGLAEPASSLGEAPEVKGFLADAPGAPLGADAPLADADGGAEPGVAGDCACQVRASGTARTPAMAGLAVLAMLLGLVARRRRRRGV